MPGDIAWAQARGSGGTVGTEARLYATDLSSHVVDVFSLDTGNVVTTFGGVGSEPGRFYFPTGVALFPDGRIAVADMLNARVQLFDGDFRLLRAMGRPGNHLGDLGKPRHLAVGPDGTIFVADAELACVHLFDDRGRLLMVLGGSNDEPGGTPMPVGLAVASRVPEPVRSLVPADFSPAYFLFVSNSTGSKRLSVYAVGRRRSP